MQLRPEQLAQHLQQDLRPVYLIAGAEPLLIQEDLDLVRAAARERGYSEREVLDVEPSFDWGRLSEAASSLSLFGDRRVLELRIPSGKPGKPGSQAITEYCKNPPEDTVLLVSCGRLDASQRKSAWVKALTAAGAQVYRWPVELREFPGWVRNRMRARGLQPAPEAVALLAERAEGNLFAAAQEIEKLLLVHGEGPLDLETTRTAVADSARYDAFDLSAAALRGDLARTLRISQSLGEEGVEPTLILWSLARDLRLLAAMAAGGAEGEAAMRGQRMPPAHKTLLQQTVRRAAAEEWEALLMRCARADRVIKGMAEGRPWDELIQLAVRVARLMRARTEC